MDPCPFLRILVGNLALKLAVASKPSLSTVHPSSTPCYCKIKLGNFPIQQAPISVVSQDDQNPEGNLTPSPSSSSSSNSLAASFSLSKTQIEKSFSNTTPCLRIEVYRGKYGSSCGFGSGKLLGRVLMNLDLKRVENRPVLMHNGWVDIGKGKKGNFSKIYVRVRAEPDPRFVFQFEKEPECSPQVFQVQGNVKQPVFTCKFSCRNNTGDRNLRSRSSLSETSTSRSWLPSLRTEKDQQAKERKGWSITIHDLSGSPVAAASMVTPFVPSPGTDRVSRSNPGAWLILRPEYNTWKPWGRLEAWTERGCSDALSYRFELLPDTSSSAVLPTTVVNSTISIKNGGKFTIDLTTNVSPMTSPSSSIDLGSASWSGSGSGDFGLGLWPHFGGFVMSSTMQGVEQKSKPEVEVGVQHVTCTEDAAAFVALAAAMDLSTDACRLFSQKLRTELRQQIQESVV